MLVVAQLTSEGLMPMLSAAWKARVRFWTWIKNKPPGVEIDVKASALLRSAAPHMEVHTTTISSQIHQ